MAKTFNWYATASSCPGAYNTQPGWYSGETFVTASYQNPTTGLAYTPSELEGLMGGATPGGVTPITTPTTTPIATPSPHAGSPNIFNLTPEDYLAYMPEGTTIEQATEALAISQQHISDQGVVAPTTAPVALPTFDPSAITPPTVTPAPPYEISPEMQEMMDLYGDKLTDWVTNPQGIPPETQAQMIQLQTDTLKAREQEAIRVMRNNMERRGITNSGYVQANMNMITSNTSVAIAGAIADVQIKSALMKMASFEKAMGAAAQFLGFLSEQSQLAYAPKFQTWQAEQLAKMQAWQASFDVYKMEINQAYQLQNMEAQAYWTGVLQEDQQLHEIEMAEMEIEATQQMAEQEATGAISGSLITGLFTLGAAFL